MGGFSIGGVNDPLSRRGSVNGTSGVDPYGAVGAAAQTSQIPGDVAAQHQTQNDVNRQTALGDVTQTQEETHANRGLPILKNYLDTVSPYFQPGGSNSVTGGLFSGFGLPNGGAVGGGTPGQIAPVNNAAADSAAFSRAKDQVGQEGNAAITGLQRAMAARGFGNGGSSIEAAGLSDVYNHGLGELADTSRQQAVTDSGQALDLAKTNYSGQITQRGQDITAHETDADRALRAAEAAEQARQFGITNQRTAIQGLLGAFGNLY